MDDRTINWLLEENNPAIRYRTQTEILGQTADVSETKQWILEKLPAEWYNIKGLWYVYYVTALSECGLTKGDIPAEHLQRSLESIIYQFEYGCTDFMLLRAMIKLGYEEHEAVRKIIKNFHDNSLPDGGYLCKRRLKSFKYIPKSCYKANIYALMFLAECKKKNMDISFGKSIIDYFLNRDIFYKSNDRSVVISQCATETFHPFEPMRFGIHTIVESFSALGYGNDDRLKQAWTFLAAFRDENGRMILNQTLTKSYLPKEKAGKESKWVTFYSVLAEKERDN